MVIMVNLYIEPIIDGIITVKLKCNRSGNETVFNSWLM